MRPNATGLKSVVVFETVMLFGNDKIIAGVQPSRVEVLQCNYGTQLKASEKKRKQKVTHDGIRI